MSVLTLVRDWWRSVYDKWFSRHETAGTDAAPQVTGAEAPAKTQAMDQVPAVAAPVKKRSYVPRQKTLHDLLSNIEHSFESIGCPTKWKWAHTSKDTVIALRKLGPHVSDYIPKDDLSDLHIDPSGKKWSALMFVSYPRTERREGVMSPVFSYAFLLRKAPWFVQQNSGGAIYECGAAWRDSDDELFWGIIYLTPRSSR